MCQSQRNCGQPRRLLLTRDQHNSVFNFLHSEEHSERAHQRYVAWFPERVTRGNGEEIYPPWGCQAHLRAAPELLKAMPSINTDATAYQGYDKQGRLRPAIKPNPNEKNP